MKTFITAALMLSAASIAMFATAQAGDFKKPDIYASPPAQVIVIEPVTGSVFPGGPTVVADGRAMASDQEVGQARRYYRSQCNTVESAGFCECVTAGVAQALAPSEVRIAARTIRERMGDGARNADMPGAASVDRIRQTEGHYANACAQYRS